MKLERLYVIDVSYIIDNFFIEFDFVYEYLKENLLERNVFTAYFGDWEKDIQKQIYDIEHKEGFKYWIINLQSEYEKPFKDNRKVIERQYKI